MRHARRFPRLLLSLFIVLAAVVSVSVATQHDPARAADATQRAAAPDCRPEHSVSNWIVHYGCQNVQIPAAHSCLKIGTSKDGKTQAVECADLYVTNTSSVQQAWGQGEFYCQGAHPKCLGMNVMIWVSIDLGEFTATTGNGVYTCNTRPACPNGGHENVQTTHYGVYGCPSMRSFEKPDGVSLNGVTSREVISISGASKASHASGTNESKNLTVCIDPKPSP